MKRTRYTYILSIAITTGIGHRSVESAESQTDPTHAKKAPLSSQHRIKLPTEENRKQLVDRYNRALITWKERAFTELPALGKIFERVLQHDGLLPHSLTPPIRNPESAVYNFLRQKPADASADSLIRVWRLVSSNPTADVTLQTVIENIPDEVQDNVQSLDRHTAQSLGRRDRIVTKAIIQNTPVEQIKGLNPALSNAEKDVIQAAQYILHGTFNTISHTRIIHLKPGALPEYVKIRATDPRAFNPYCANLANRGALRATYHSKFMKELAVAVCSGVFCTFGHPKAFKAARDDEMNAKDCFPWTYPTE